jgi:hypothetical protein
VNVFDNDEMRQVLEYIGKAKIAYEALEDAHSKARIESTRANRLAFERQLEVESLTRQVKSLEGDLRTAIDERDSFRVVCDDQRDRATEWQRTSIACSGELASVYVALAEVSDKLVDLMASWQVAHAAEELDVMACVLGLGSVSVGLAATVFEHRSRVGAPQHAVQIKRVDPPTPWRPHAKRAVEALLADMKQRGRAPATEEVLETWTDIVAKEMELLICGPDAEG